MRKKIPKSLNYNIDGKDLEFYAINSTISVFSYSKKFHITPENTTGLIYLLLKRASEGLYSNISISWKDREGKSDLNNQITEGYPVNSILIEIADKGLWFNIVSTQTVSYDGKILYFDYPDLLFIDRFAVDNESVDYREDVRVINSTLYDLCNRPTTLKIVFHVLHKQANDSLKKLQEKHGETFQNQYCIMENDINVKILYRHLDKLQNFSSKTTKIKSEFYNFLYRAEQRMKEREFYKEYKTKS